MTTTTVKPHPAGVEWTPNRRVMTPNFLYWLTHSYHDMHMRDLIQGAGSRTTGEIQCAVNVLWGYVDTHLPAGYTVYGDPGTLVWDTEYPEAPEDAWTILRFDLRSTATDVWDRVADLGSVLVPSAAVIAERTDDECTVSMYVDELRPDGERAPTSGFVVHLPADVDVATWLHTVFGTTWSAAWSASPAVLFPDRAEPVPLESVVFWTMTFTPQGRQDVREFVHMDEGNAPSGLLEALVKDVVGESLEPGVYTVTEWLGDPGHYPPGRYPDDPDHAPIRLVEHTWDNRTSPPSRPGLPPITWSVDDLGDDDLVRTSDTPDMIITPPSIPPAPHLGI